MVYGLHIVRLFYVEANILSGFISLIMEFDVEENERKDISVRKRGIARIVRGRVVPNAKITCTYMRSNSINNFTLFKTSLSKHIARYKRKLFITLIMKTAPATITHRRRNHGQGRQPSCIFMKSIYWLDQCHVIWALKKKTRVLIFQTRQNYFPVW